MRRFAYEIFWKSVDIFSYSIVPTTTSSSFSQTHHHYNHGVVVTTLCCYSWHSFCYQPRVCRLCSQHPTFTASQQTILPDESYQPSLPLHKHPPRHVVLLCDSRPTNLATDHVAHQRSQAIAQILHGTLGFHVD